MPPRRYSRHSFTQGIQLADLDDERVFLTDRTPFSFRNLEDNRTHVIKTGDTLFRLAAHYYRGLPRPAGFWWVIADFQPDPIHDPTIPLEVGSTIILPSMRTLLEEIFSERRRGL